MAQRNVRLILGYAFAQPAAAEQSHVRKEAKGIRKRTQLVCRRLTSFNSSYQPANGVLRTFNGWGQMTREYQDHTWFGSTSSPNMQYRYSEMPGGANYSRLDGFEYPSPGEFDQEYDYTGVDDRISRVSVVHLKGDSDVLALAYLGLGTAVWMTNPVTIRTYIGTGTGDAGDQYTGLDRFGRVVDLTWTTGGSGATVNDRYQYGYDRDSNRLWRDNVQNTAFGELYAYDALNQLTSMSRGTLNSTHTALTGSASRSQSWTADGAGNFTTVTTDGTGQSRSYNAQNQFTALGSATPTYDANGNLLTDGTWTYTYDAWNRLVSATNGTTTVTYGYDALGRRITETTGGVTTHLYYNQNWQVVEERVGGTASSNLRAQYVWSPVESDVLIYRDRDTNADGELDERLYVQQDVQGNVTALVNTSGTVVERYAYDAYGKATPYTASWGTPSGGTTQYAWQYLHQGLRYDAADALYDNRMRIYSAEYMRFLQNDPIGFAAGDPDTYRYVGNGPTGHTDPSGLFPPSPSPNSNFLQQPQFIWNSPSTIYTPGGGGGGMMSPGALLNGQIGQYLPSDGTTPFPGNWWTGGQGGPQGIQVAPPGPSQAHSPTIFDFLDFPLVRLVGFFEPITGTITSGADVYREPSNWRNYLGLLPWLGKPLKRILFGAKTVGKGGQLGAAAGKCAVAPSRTSMGWRIPINEGGAINAVGKAGNIEIEIIANMSRTGKTITLDGIHFTKNAGGTLGPKQLQEFGRDFLRQHGNGATELVINPAPRTTGALAGTGVAPKPITIKLE
ncbi:MAG: RHS repeat-associated core domain-containing protein [Gemmataceae bacterium]